MKRMVDIPTTTGGYTCIANGLICDKCKAETYEYIHSMSILASDSPLYEKFGYQKYVTPIVDKYTNIDLCPDCQKKTTATEIIEISKRRQEETKLAVQKIFIDYKPPEIRCTITVQSPSIKTVEPLPEIKLFQENLDAL